MRTYPRTNFKHLQKLLAHDLREAPEVNPGEWHSLSVADNPMLISQELTNVVFELDIPSNPLHLQEEVKPNLPWAEDHFRERVCGKPLNPPPSEAWWPFAQQGNAVHKTDKQFSHTYPERFWPKKAGYGDFTSLVVEGVERVVPRRGIRYEYGDLDDVVNQLRKNPLTRQAYLPVWFPEDTGAVHGERVPCTLGYHFLVRRERLNCSYFIRSCDFMRHFPDDVYMAGRLMQWVASWLGWIKPGTLTMHIGSFHIFKGDLGKIKEVWG